MLSGHPNDRPRHHCGLSWVESGYILGLAVLNNEDRTWRGGPHISRPKNVHPDGSSVESAQVFFDVELEPEQVPLCTETHRRFVHTPGEHSLAFQATRMASMFASATFCKLLADVLHGQSSLFRTSASH